MTAIKSIWEVLRKSWKQMVVDNAFGLSAGLAFYTALSFGPVLTLLVSIGGRLSDKLTQQIISQAEELIGPNARDVAEMVLANASENPSLGSLASIVSIVALVLASTAVFAQLQAALNMIWGMKVKSEMGILGWLWKRGMSILMLLAIGALLLGSLFAESLVRYILPFGGIGANIIDFVIPLLALAILFAFVFSLMADAKIDWRDVLFGASVTAILFMAGKWLFSTYISRTAVGSAYGAAGSFFVFLLWIYYSAIILFFGAEATQVFASKCGRGLEPRKHAEWR